MESCIRSSMCYNCKVYKTGQICFKGESEPSSREFEAENSRSFFKRIREPVYSTYLKAMVLKTLASTAVSDFIDYIRYRKIDSNLDPLNKNNYHFHYSNFADHIYRCNRCLCYFSSSVVCRCSNCLDDSESHYVILMHGVLTSPLMMADCCNALFDYYPNLYVYFPVGVCGKTLHGTCNVLKFLIDEMDLLFSKIPSKFKLSLVGHSFGGILLRYFFIYYLKTTKTYSRSAKNTPKTNTDKTNTGSTNKDNTTSSKKDSNTKDTNDTTSSNVDNTSSSKEDNEEKNSKSESVSRKNTNVDFKTDKKEKYNKRIETKKSTKELKFKTVKRSGEKDITWKNMIFVATPHAGIYENNVEFRKLVSLIGSETVNELENMTIDLLFLLKDDGFLDKFENVLVYGNISGDMMVAPRTSIILPNHLFSERRVSRIIDMLHKSPGYPVSITSIPYSGSIDTYPTSPEELNETVIDSDSEFPDAINLSSKESVEESVVRELSKNIKLEKEFLDVFSQLISSKIKSTKHIQFIQQLVTDSDMDASSNFQQNSPNKRKKLDKTQVNLFNTEDLNKINETISEIVRNSSDNLLDRMREDSNLFYFEVLLTMLYKLRASKFAVYIPRIHIPHRSIISLQNPVTKESYTRNVLLHITNLFLP